MLNLLSLSRSNGLKVDVSNGGGSEDLDGEASRSTLEGTKWGGVGKSDELGREDGESSTVSGVVEGSRRWKRRGTRVKGRS